MVGVGASGPVAHVVLQVAVLAVLYLVGHHMASSNTRARRSGAAVAVSNP
jgi:hypothetical protein